MKRIIIIATLCTLLIATAGAGAVSGGKEGTGHRSSPPTGQPVKHGPVYDVQSQIGTKLGTIKVTATSHPLIYDYELHARGLQPDAKYRLDYIASAPLLGEHWEHVALVTSGRVGQLDATGEMRIVAASDLDTAHFMLIRTG